MNLHSFTFKILICTFLSLAINQSHAQEKKKLEFNGYIKNLQSYSGGLPFGDEIYGLNFFHNRLMFDYDASKHLKLNLEMRNRFFYGSQLELTQPSFTASLDDQSELIDLSYEETWGKNQPVFSSIIDRANFTYEGKKYMLRLGRQRINWGINLAWNPNDIFNAFNYFNFDYEERPGTDAALFRYYTGPLSSLDIAVQPGRAEEDWIAAARYKFNIKGYDLQLISGKYRNDLMGGLGWAGNIGSVGFKGEASYFIPYTGNRLETLSASFSLDYLFSSNTYLNLGYLYNETYSSGQIKSRAISINGVSAQQLSPKNLFPSEHSVFLNASHPITPLINASLTAMPIPANNSFILMPNITYSISESWDVDILSQSVFQYKSGNQTDLRHNFSTVFLRVKWSF